MFAARRGTWLGLAALALVAGVAWSWWSRSSSETPRAASTLLAIALPDVNGVSQPLAQWKGKLMIVNFWATWCAPCREEMPLFVRVQREHADRVQFVGIAVDDAAKVKRFGEELGVNYPLLVGGYGAMELSKVLGNRVAALPFTVVLDAGGRLIFTQLGPLNDETLARIVGNSL
ncbi:MAG TPA: TlpA disulfide reductase family protein [Casimicrobiaceae bacterium]|nr:TlpA disulfide reductase family protein [Casimicrobiaceae bacterium]